MNYHDAAREYFIRGYKDFSQPIIESLLDLDLYKLTMNRLAFERFPEVDVKYGFKNRTSSISLLGKINKYDLMRQFRMVTQLNFKQKEVNYLKSLDLFDDDFLIFLRKLSLSMPIVNERKGQYEITVQGNWPEVMLWETIILSIVNELYYRKVLASYTLSERLAIFEKGKRLLSEKIKILKNYPGILISEFGTRRRLAKVWQGYVLSWLKNQVNDNLLGTSNVWFAWQLGLKPIGTFAHELDMVFSGIYHESDEDIKNSHNKVLQYWWQMYGYPLSIALTDTYGSPFFFRDMSFEQAKKWKGLRHDSGCPIEFGKKAIEFYENLGINPKEKLLVFSDGLNIKTILKIYNQFYGRIKIAFGWGTNLTNDVGLKTLSLVVKAIEANGHGTVKLSDNLAKAMGSKEYIERFKRIFGHTVTLNEECVY